MWSEKKSAFFSFFLNNIRIFAIVNVNRLFAIEKITDMDWLHIIAVIALIIIGVMIYINKRK